MKRVILQVQLILNSSVLPPPIPIILSIDVYLHAVAKGHPWVIRTHVAPTHWCGFDAVAGLSLPSPSPESSQLFPNPKSLSLLRQVPDPSPLLARGYLSSKKNPQQLLKPRRRFRPGGADTAASSKLGCGGCHRHAAQLSPYPCHSRSLGPPLASSSV